MVAGRGLGIGRAAVLAFVREGAEKVSWFEEIVEVKTKKSWNKEGREEVWR